jgi:hypothetical protein
MYFNKFSKIEYKIDNRNYELLDIFTRVSFVGDYANSKLYDKYTIQEGETPDDVSGVVYKDLSLSWLVILTNNIFSEDEWYSGDNTFLNIVNKKYSGESYYITNIPALKEGDVMVKVLTTSGTSVTTIDETTYRVVGGFDKNFRRVWGRGGSGTFSAGDNIMFGRKNTQTGAVDIIDFVDSSNIEIKTQYATVRLVEERKNSPVELLQYTNDIVVPPNVVFSSGTIQSSYIPSNTIYTNSSDTTPNFANTLLYYYMTNSGTVPGIRKETFYSTEYDKYKEKQIISVIKPDYVPNIVSTIQDLLRNNEIGKRIVIRF